jgi:hypothetical protein
VNYPPAPYVTVECKNFTGDPANPELDQLIGRFTNVNGKLGVMAVRKLKNRPLFIARRNDAAKPARDSSFRWTMMTLRGLSTRRPGETRRDSIGYFTSDSSESQSN